MTVLLSFAGLCVWKLAVSKTDVCCEVLADVLPCGNVMIGGLTFEKDGPFGIYGEGKSISSKDLSRLERLASRYGEPYIIRGVIDSLNLDARSYVRIIISAHEDLKFGILREKLLINNARIDSFAIKCRDEKLCFFTWSALDAYENTNCSEYPDSLCGFRIGMDVSPEGLPCDWWFWDRGINLESKMRNSQRRQLISKKYLGKDMVNNTGRTFFLRIDDECAYKDFVRMLIVLKEAGYEKIFVFA